MKLSSKTVNGARNGNDRHGRFRELLRLRGRLARGAHRSGCINEEDGEDSFLLGENKFLLLALLMSHILLRAGKSADIAVPDVPYLSADDILQTLDGFQLKHYKEILFFRNSIPSDIHTAIKRVRAKFKDVGFCEELIGNGPLERGYRLRLHPENLTMDVDLKLTPAEIREQLEHIKALEAKAQRAAASILARSVAARPLGSPVLAKPAA